MKGAIASVEIFVFAPPPAATVRPATSDPDAPVARAAPRRLSLVIGMPVRGSDGGGWQCRVALADLHRPVTFEGRDSVEALARAIERGRTWLTALEAEGFALYRDRAGAEPFVAAFPS